MIGNSTYTCCLYPAGKNKRYSMRKLIYFITFILSLSFIGCGKKLNEHSQRDSFAQYCDTLIGKFNGIDIDTLIAEPIDTTKERAMWDWRIYGTQNTVDTLILTQRFIVKMIQEGDLDGNGTDEFGVRREIDHGTWDSYFIYSYNGKWQYLINPIWTLSTHYYGELNKGNDVAEKTNNPNIIKVRFSDIRNNGDFLIIDTLIKVNPQDIELLKYSD